VAGDAQADLVGPAASTARSTSAGTCTTRPDVLGRDYGGVGRVTLDGCTTSASRATPSGRLFSRPARAAEEERALICRSQFTSDVAVEL
jgi:hypothetical protein